MRSATPSWPRRGSRPAALFAGLAVALLASAAVAQASGPAAYRNSLRQIDTQLRLAIESRPAELGEYMRSSEIICGMAERSEARGEAQGSASDWNALSQAVRELDNPAARSVDDAFSNADSRLLALQKRFSRAWRGQGQRVRALTRGVLQTRAGIRTLRAAMRTIAAAFAYWDQRQCAAANQGIEAGVRRIPAGVDRVNLGMSRLLRLAYA